MSIWRNRDARLVLGGDLINNIGDWMLLGAYGGSLADQWNLRLGRDQGAA